jgi:AcrR family transcriptional regulator
MVFCLGSNKLMRVTAETKAATRRQILQVSRRLFAEKGFDSTTTRDIALAAGTATGTLFNYFPTKEAIVACLAAEPWMEHLRKCLMTRASLKLGTKLSLR